MGVGGDEGPLCGTELQYEGEREAAQRPTAGGALTPVRLGGLWCGIFRQWGNAQRGEAPAVVP